MLEINLGYYRTHYTPKCMTLPKEGQEAELCFLRLLPELVLAFLEPRPPLIRGTGQEVQGCGDCERPSRLSRDVGGWAWHRPAGELDHVRLGCPQPARRMCAGGRPQARLRLRTLPQRSRLPGASIAPESPCCTWRPRVGHWSWCAYSCDPHGTQAWPRGPAAQTPRGRQDS